MGIGGLAAGEALFQQWVNTAVAEEVEGRGSEKGSQKAGKRGERQRRQASRPSQERQIAPTAEEHGKEGKPLGLAGETPAADHNIYNSVEHIVRR